MYRDNPTPVIFSRARRAEHEQEVKPHLAYSLAEAAECLAQGKPISQANMGTYDDGITADDISLDNLPLENRRFANINDAWNEEQSRRSYERRYGVTKVQEVLK